MVRETLFFIAKYADLRRSRRCRLSCETPQFWRARAWALQDRIFCNTEENKLPLLPFRVTIDEKYELTSSE